MKLNDSSVKVGVGFFFTAAGLVFFWLSSTMENPIGQPIGPGYVPALIALCMAVAAATMMVADFRKMRRGKKKEAGTDLKPADADRKVGGELRVLVGTALAFATVFVWSYAGYIVGMSLAVFAIVLLDRKIEFKWGLLYSVSVTLVMWLIFFVALQVELG
jgi:hypothetical protein